MGDRGTGKRRDMYTKKYATTSTVIIFMMATSVLEIPGGGGTMGMRTLKVVNRCKEKIWPGILSNAGWAPVGGGGFALDAGQWADIVAPQGWSGRIWARTGCSSAIPSGGNLHCATGDCAGRLSCAGAGASLPVTLVELSLASPFSPSALDFYDISLVDGFNVPVSVAPVGSSTTISAAIATNSANNYACGVAACEIDLNERCPAELRVVAMDGTAEAAVVGCKSACDAFKGANFCCSGSYATAGACRPSAYARLFKAACPRAYSYAFDDPTSTFTCPAAAASGGDAATVYSIVFCPSERSTTLDNNTRTNDSSYLSYETYNAQTAFSLLITIIFFLY